MPWTAAREATDYRPSCRFGELLTLLAKAGDRVSTPSRGQSSRELLVAALHETGKAGLCDPPDGRRPVSRSTFGGPQEARPYRGADAGQHPTDWRTCSSAATGDSDLARTTAVLARAAQDAIWRFTRANQELQAWSIGARRDRSFTFCPSPTESGWVVGVSAANTHDTALMQAMATAIPAVGSRRGPWRRNPASFAPTRASTAPSTVGG